MSWHGKASEAGHVEEVSPKASPSFTSKLKAHFKRFWWLHLIIFIACTLIIVLCLVYVAFPRISQNGISASTLSITSLILSNPTPNSFHLRQTSIIGNPSRYHPRLDAFNASLSLPDAEPYAYIEIPALHATAEATSVVDQDVTIEDLAAFTRYSAEVLGGESVEVEVKGKTALHEMRFPVTTVTYDKTVKMKGLNKLTGFNVTEFSIKLAPEADGTNMIGTVSIPNPSVMTISMGNVTFNNYITPPSPSPPTPLFIGTSHLQDLTLRPGENTLPLRSRINQTLVLAQIQENFPNGIVPVDIVGNSSVFNDQHLPYFELPLSGLKKRIELDVGRALKEAGLDIGMLTGAGGGGSGGGS